ncbi:DEAD/DEAH box helicase [Aliikangiella sp. IMCC44653]
MNFSHLELHPDLIKSLQESGYTEPSPIQAKVIPSVLAGKDVMAAAQTGTGKTAGFTLPILQRLIGSSPVLPNQAKVLILAPTRELAAQVNDNVNKYAKYLNISSFMVCGGVKINPQMQRLRRGVDILVATPGRLIDLMNQNAVKFPNLEFLVLDEADRMLDMGFLPDIKRIMNKLSKQRQTLLFSATFSKEITQLCLQLLNDPVSISVSPANTTANTVRQWIHPVDKKRKSKLLAFLIGDGQWQQVLVFVRTKRGANKLAFDLDKSGIKSAAIHGDKSQGTRNRVLKEFKENKLQVLVATDIAARGLDIQQLPHVVNFDLPNVAEDYVHRIGRTGRAGATGEAVSLVSADEVEHLSGIENLIQQKLKRILVDGFEPEHSVPETRLKSVKKKKPHKKKIAKLAQNKSGRAQNATNKKKPSSKPTGAANSKKLSSRRPKKG